MRYKVFKKKFQEIDGARHVKMRDGREFEARGYTAVCFGSLGSKDPVCTEMTLINGENRQEIDPFEIEEVF
jgi:hypothetical protein